MNVQIAFDDWRRWPVPTMAQIAAQVAAKHGLTVSELRDSTRRVRRVSWPRHEAMWRIRQETNQSLPAIARFFGGMDHTSVLHGVRIHQKRMSIAVGHCELSPSLQTRAVA